MRRYFHFILLCLIATAPAVEAQLNPLKWFSSSEPEREVATPEEEAAARDLLDEGMSRLEAGKEGAANRRFKEIIEDYPTSEAAAEALFRRSRIFMADGKWEKAFDTLQEIVDYHPGYENFNRVIGAQFECATALMEGARGRILWVIPGFRQYGTAREQFERIVSNAPYSDYAPLSLMNIALLAEDRDKPEEAIDALDRLISYYPQSMLAPDAYFNLAETYSGLVKGHQYDQGSTREAINYYEDFLILFPKSEYVDEVEANLKAMENLLAKSRLHLGDFYYLHRNNNTAALIFYNETITVAPESDAADTARERIADIEAGVQPATGNRILRTLLLVD